LSSQGEKVCSKKTGFKPRPPQREMILRLVQGNTNNRRERGCQQGKFLLNRANTRCTFAKRFRGCRVAQNTQALGPRLRLKTRDLQQFEPQGSCSDDDREHSFTIKAGVKLWGMNKQGKTGGQISSEGCNTKSDSQIPKPSGKPGMAGQKVGMGRALPWAVQKPTICSRGAGWGGDFLRLIEGKGKSSCSVERLR